MKNYIKVRDFDGDVHPWVTTLDGVKDTIDTDVMYELLGTCDTTGLNVILDPENERLLLIQSIDCEYHKSGEE